MEKYLKIISETFFVSEQADQEWVRKYREIYQYEEMMYRRGKCHEFKSIWTQKGRDAFQICSIRAKVHGLRKVVAYLKTFSTKDPKQQGYIKNTINAYTKMILQMEKNIKILETQQEK